MGVQQDQFCTHPQELNTLPEQVKRNIQLLLLNISPKSMGPQLQVYALLPPQRNQ